MIGERVQVYWHPKTSTFAVRDVSSCCVVDRPTHVVLCNADFVVNDEKRRESLQCGYRNNHAWIEGSWAVSLDVDGGDEVVTYSPDENERFVTAAGKTVVRADWVECTVVGGKPVVRVYHPIYGD